MCDPVVAAAVVSTVAAGASARSQIKAAKRQTKAVRAQQAVVAEETRQQASGELFEQMRATRREQGRIRAAAGEAGLSLTSQTIEGLLADSAMQGGLQGSRTIANMESRHAANTAEAAAMLSQIHKPTAIGVGLQVGSAAAEGWANVEMAKLAKRRAAAQG